ncbi:MAG: DUF1549 and DUF1553 domain-containing protein, partial [Planctomycetota bacterium]
TLVRRVYLDLIGLPPTPIQVQQFIDDDRPDAYERLVDQLLNTPQYGEHMARFWLDLVRYGDTHGLHLDNYREMWPYRDWVISAFDDNMPFDQFIKEQLAGDLLPGSTNDQKIASGFNRLNVTTSEGGSIYDEVFFRNVVDRTDAFGTIFLGLTTQCAVCHDHKFDPISQRDYYSLSAFFNSLDGRALDGNAKDHPPVLKIESEESQKELRELGTLIAERAAQLNGDLPAVDAAQVRWEQQLSHPTDAIWESWAPGRVTSKSGQTMRVNEDHSVDALGVSADTESTGEKEPETESKPTIPGNDVYTLVYDVPPGVWQSLQLQALVDEQNERAGTAPNGNAVLSEVQITTAPKDSQDFLPVRIAMASADHEQSDGKFAISYAIDGKITNNEGWAIGGHQKTGPRNASIVFASPIESSATLPQQLKIQLHFAGTWTQHLFRRTRVNFSQGVPSIPKDKQIRVEQWHQAGPFSVAKASDAGKQKFAAEGGVFDVKQSFTYRDETITWQPVDVQPLMVHSLPVVDDHVSATVLHTTVHAPDKQSITMLLGNTDGIRIHLNKKQLVLKNQIRAHSPLRDEYELDLKKGRNDLYIRVVNQNGQRSKLTYALRSPAVPTPDSVRSVAAIAADKRSDDQRQSLRQYFRRVASQHPELQMLQAAIDGLKTEQKKIRDAMPTTLIWRETVTPRQAHIHIRGAYDKKGDAVPRDVPHFLPPMDDSLPKNRLGLAKWLVDPKNPLTARVAVNRFWQQVFGHGLVKTSEDFGAQGETPSHPQLLDHLAIRFRDSQWDVKDLMRYLVTSDTYRRDSKVHPSNQQIDPENRFFARGPRFRLDAETLRDQALAVSNLLVEKRGGPGVKPPQPDGLWYAVAYTDSNTARFSADEGAKIYRRSVYTFWKRTSAPPQMSTFDAPSRESCTARRERTNTPLQALLLMNEKQYLSAASALADQFRDGPGTITERISAMFSRALCRPPTTREVTELETLLSDLLSRYQQRGGEDAHRHAWALLASTLMNLDEFVNK